MSDSNGWVEYKRLVLTEIEELKKAKRELEKTVEQLRVEVATLKTKIWMHMLLTGSAAASGAGLVEWLLR